MKKRVFILALALLLFLSTMPGVTLTAHAAEVIVSTWDELYTALSTDGSVITLAKDVKYGEGGGDNASGILYVQSGSTVTLDLNGHTIDRQQTSGLNAYVIGVEGKLTVKDTSEDAGGKLTGGACGVYVWGSNAVFVLEGGSITGNRSSVNTYGNGGGVWVGGDGIFEMYGGSITDNTAEKNGGGVCILPGSYNSSSFRMAGGTISGNTAGLNGGGVFVNMSTFTMTGGVIGDPDGIDGNTASSGGGVALNGGTVNLTNDAVIMGNKVASEEGPCGAGVFVNSGTLKMSNGALIRANQSAVDGGGVYLKGGAFEMSGGTITAHTVPGYGGGVFVGSDASFAFSGGTIGGSGDAGNTADQGGGVYAAGRFDMTGNSAAIVGNTAVNFGGGLRLGGDWEFTIAGGTITQNTASNYLGGGVFLSYGTLLMSGGTIVNNKAERGGGFGAWESESTFKLSGGSIIGNTAAGRGLGGGIFSGADSTVYISGNVRVSGNTAAAQGGGIWKGGEGELGVSGRPIIISNTSNGADNNVYLASGKQIRITNDLLTDGTHAPPIGVTTEDVPAEGSPVVFTNGLNLYGDEGCFTSDNSAYTVSLNGALEAQLELAPEVPPGPEIDRIAGSNRYLTAFDAADRLKEELGVTKFENIVIASGTDFPDALAGAYLASVKKAPILLTNAGAAPVVADYVKNNMSDSGTVYILGGFGAVPEVMEKSLNDRDITKIERLSGSNRYVTNKMILEAAGVTGKDLLVCSGKDYADSLSASAAGLPILLVGDALLPDQITYLESVKDEISGNIYAIGGAGAVSEKVFSAVAAYGTGEIGRLAGLNRYKTSTAVAEKFFPGGSTIVVLAYAMDFPDGLAGGPVAYSLHAPLLLVTNSVYGPAQEYAAGAGAFHATIMGGPALISDAAAKTIIGAE